MCIVRQPLHGRHEDLRNDVLDTDHKTALAPRALHVHHLRPGGRACSVQTWGAWVSGSIPICRFVCLRNTTSRPHNQSAPSTIDTTSRPHRRHLATTSPRATGKTASEESGSSRSVRAAWQNPALFSLDVLGRTSLYCPLDEKPVRNDGQRDGALALPLSCIFK